MSIKKVLALKQVRDDSDHQMIHRARPVRDAHGHVRKDSLQVLRQDFVGDHTPPAAPASLSNQGYRTCRREGNARLPFLRWIARISVSAAIVCSLVVEGLTTSHAADTTLTILHTSEHHGTALPLGRPGQPRVGGMAARAAVIASVRRDAEAVLLLDSGDILVGSALSSFYRGEPDIKAMNLMAYQAMAVGNHEFDYGLRHLARLSRLADFPLLCSNLEADRQALPCRRATVVKAGQVVVGLISLLGRSNFPDSFNREVATVLSISDPAITAQRLAERLKSHEGAHLVVAITHQTTVEDLHVLANAPSVDVIVGGHTEGFDGLRSMKTIGTVTGLRDPGPVFVKTHRQGRTIGRLDLDLVLDPDSATPVNVVRARATNLPVSDTSEPNPEVYTLLEGYSRRLEAESGTVVGRSLVRLNGENVRVRSQESNLGNLLADLLRERFGTDVGLVNGGQIRDSIPPGPVDIKRVMSVLPFDSPAVTFTVSGTVLREALENSASRLPGNDGRFLQVSGLAVTYDVSAPPGSRVRDVQVGGEPLTSNRTYSVATDSFLADGGDGYGMFALAQSRVDRQIPMRDLLLEALRSRPLKSSERGRIRFVDRPTIPR